MRLFAWQSLPEATPTPAVLRVLNPRLLELAKLLPTLELRGHLHDDRYSQLGHLHDGRYSQLGHAHDDRYLRLAGGTISGPLNVADPVSPTALELGRAGGGDTPYIDFHTSAYSDYDVRVRAWGQVLEVNGGLRVFDGTGRVYLGTIAMQGFRGLEIVERSATCYEIRHHDPAVAWQNIALCAIGGSVGIGNIGPLAPLDVTGSVRVRGGLIHTNGEVGFGAGQWIGVDARPGSLPGYPADSYPTLRTTFSSLYFSVGGAYSANMSTGGVLTAVSARHLKTDFLPLDLPLLLDAVADHYEATSWRFRADPEDVRHIGPVADNFHALFGLGGVDPHMVSSIDPAGVALAGVKGLVLAFRALETRLAALEHAPAP